MDFDFDIFAPDDDDDDNIIVDNPFNPVDMEPLIDMDLNNKLIDDTRIMPEMHCSGADSWSSQFSSKGFIRNSFISIYHLNHFVSKSSLSTLSYDQSEDNFEDPQFVAFFLAQACIHVQNLVKEINELQLGNNDKKPNKTNNYNYDNRRKVTVMLYMLVHTKVKCWPMLCQHVERLRALINSITSMEVLKRIFNAHHARGTACESPAHHLMHGVLEWKLLDLCLLNQQTQQFTGTEQTADEFFVQLERVMDDLITCAIFVYLKKNNAELLYCTPFACTCFREMWLLLQLALPKWYSTDTSTPLNFWSLFNAGMTRLSTKLEMFALKELNYWEFNNWLMSALTRLYGYAANGEFIGESCARAKFHFVQNYEAHEACTRNFLLSNPNEENLRVFICLLQPVMLYYAEPKIDIPTLMWEFFNKRLNNNFYEIGTSPSKLSVTCSTGRAYIKRYKLLFSNLQDTLSAQMPQYDANLNSFTLFILLFCKTLERLYAENNQHNAQKLLGRIYSKFSAPKFLQLNECGIHHTIELFLGMALCGNCHDLLPKLREKLLLISLEKVNATRQLAVTKGHMALLLLHAEHGIEMEEYLNKFLHQLNIINYDLGVCRILADCLMEIFSTQVSLDFTHGEHRLIATWLPNYLEKCTQTEQDRTLEALHMLFLKINNADKLYAEKWYSVLQALCEYLLPFVKSHYAKSFSNWLPLLAANFCTISTYTTKLNHNESIMLFTYFIETPTANRQAVTQFMLHVLGNTNSGEQMFTDIHVLQVWLKSLVLLGHGNAEVQKLTSHVTKLPLCATLSNLTPMEELTYANEPLTLFTAAVARNYEKSSHNYQQRCHIADNFNMLLQNFERWLPITSDMPLEQQQQPLEQYVRFYNFIATVIYNCPQIVYVKSKQTCFFHIAFTRFILPTNIQIGKMPEIKYAQTIHKVWPLLVQGIGRLNYKSDTYVQKTLNDLILKWIPHFKISSNTKNVARPFITCLRHQNQELALLICEKIARNFLKTERRQANKHACLVIILFEESLNAVINIDTVDEQQKQQQLQQLETLIKGIGFHVFEHIMLVDEIVPSRHMLLKFLQRLCTCNLYIKSENLKYIFAEQLRLLTRKHLAYQTFFYFDLIKQLVTITKPLVSDIWDTLTDEILSVEHKRGVGRDQRMRDCVQQIEYAMHFKKS